MDKNVMTLMGVYMELNIHLIAGLPSSGSTYEMSENMYIWRSIKALMYTWTYDSNIWICLGYLGVGMVMYKELVCNSSSSL